MSKSISEVKEELKEALLETGIVRSVSDTSCVDGRSISVEFHDNVPRISIECGYGGQLKCYGSLYCKMVTWKDIKSAIRSIRKKHDQHLENRERENQRLMKKIEREHRDEYLKARATAKFGGRAKCIIGLFGNEFSIRVHLDDEDQVMKFIEHNKELIDDNGRWIL